MGRAQLENEQPRCHRASRLLKTNSYSFDLPAALVIKFTVGQLRPFLEDLSMQENQFTELPLIKRPSLSSR
jgi:hypothetical protein